MPAKKISYQAKLKQKIKENPPIQYNQRATRRTTISDNIQNKRTFSQRYFGCYVLICIIIGAGVIIGFSVQEDLQNRQSSTSTTPNSDTSDAPTTTTSSTPYSISGSVTTIHGSTYQLSSFQGKTLILYFTGGSCIPCKAQLPYLVSAYNQYKSTNKVEVVSLDIQGKTVEELKTWETENGITWKVCQDTGMALSSQFSVYSMPTLVILDENGNELTRYVGKQEEATINQIFKDATS